MKSAIYIKVYLLVPQTSCPQCVAVVILLLRLLLLLLLVMLVVMPATATTTTGTGASYSRRTTAQRIGVAHWSRPWGRHGDRFLLLLLPVLLPESGAHVLVVADERVHRVARPAR